MIINLSNIGSGGGGSYVLPAATASRLGGVKIGSGITVQNDGTISVSGGSGSNITIYDINELSGYTGQQLYAVYQEIVGKIESGLTDYAFQYKVEGEALTNLTYSGIVYTHNVTYNRQNYLITIDFGEYLPINADSVNYWPSYKIHADIWAETEYPENTYLEVHKTEVVPIIASQNKLGNVKVGSGLTIDSGGTLSVSGGSDSSTVKYLTEDTWPGAYWEVGTGEMNKWGASIRRPDYTEIFETYFNTNQCIVMGEGNLGDTDSGEGNFTITDENDHIMLDKQGNRYVFKMDFTNGRLYFYHSPDQTGSFHYEGAQGAQYVTGSTTGTVHIELAKVLSGNTWIQKDEILFPKTYFIDNMTDAERVELYNLIKYSGPKVSPIAKYCRFFSELDNKDGFMGMCEVYFGRFDSGTYLSFTGSVPSRNSNTLFKVNFNLNPNGSIQGKTITEYDLTVHS